MEHKLKYVFYFFRLSLLKYVFDVADGMCASPRQRRTV